MSCIYSQCVQGSDEWLAERAGKVSASCFSNILTRKGAKTTGETRKKYLYQLAGERLSGEAEESFKSGWMERGNALEADARDTFERKTGLFVAQVGMVYLDERKTISCSPDGIIGSDSGLEIKCPKISTHIDYVIAKKIPSAYVQQVQGSMWVCGRETWNFFSYHPAIKPFHILVERDEKYISILREAVEEFAAEVEALVERLR